MYESMLNIFLCFNFLTFLIKMPFFSRPESLVRKNHKKCVPWLVESAIFFFFVPVWFRIWIGKHMSSFSVVLLYCIILFPSQLYHLLNSDFQIYYKNKKHHCTFFEHKLFRHIMKTFSLIFPAQRKALHRINMICCQLFINSHTTFV